MSLTMCYVSVTMCGDGRKGSFQPLTPYTLCLLNPSTSFLMTARLLSRRSPLAFLRLIISVHVSFVLLGSCTASTIPRYFIFPSLCIIRLVQDIVPFPVMVSLLKSTPFCSMRARVS